MVSYPVLSACLKPQPHRNIPTVESPKTCWGCPSTPLQRSEFPRSAKHTQIFSFIQLIPAFTSIVTRQSVHFLFWQLRGQCYDPSLVPEMKVVTVLELGVPLEMIQLLQTPWEERFKVRKQKQGELISFKDPRTLVEGRWDWYWSSSLFADEKSFE